MARIKMDMSDITVGGPKLPPGRYVAEVSDVVEKDSTAGNPMLEWTWEVLQGDFAGTTIKSWTSLLENALFGLKGHLQGLGIDADDPDLDVDTDELIGERAVITVAERTYKDKETREERSTSSISAVEPYNAKSKKAKAAKPARTETRSSGKKTKKRRDEDEDEDEYDDDVPF